MRDGVPPRRSSPQTPAAPGHFARHAIAYALLGLPIGMAVGWLFPLAAAVDAAFAVAIEAYELAAPVLLYFILAPSLLKVVNRSGLRGAGFSLYTVWWFARLRLAACLFAVGAVSLCYGLPLSAAGGPSLRSALDTSLASVSRSLVSSPYFFAIYASAATVLLLAPSRGRAARVFARLPDFVEKLGERVTHVVPLFTFLVGIHVATLPQVLERRFAAAPPGTFQPVRVLGLTVGTADAGDLFVLYLLLSLLTGVVCTLWHLLLLARVKLKMPGFSVARYFSTYFVRIYPLLWATSSEALATPLNLSLVRRHLPEVHESVARLSIGLGAVVNINGTLICCFVLIPPICMMLGLPVSVVGLLLCLPVVYVVGFGVPGVPGELVLFAGPVMEALQVPAEGHALFLLAFLGMQLGLPDSFRTGANSTDAGVAGLLLDRKYRARQDARTMEREPVAEGGCA